MEDYTKQTLVVGAGALGSMYAERLSAAGMPVAFLADGARAERLRQGGVVVNDTALHIPVYTPAEYQQLPAPRFILVALKHHHLPEALHAVAAVAGEDTVVFSVMNGIDSEAQIAAALGESLENSRVIFAMAAGMDAVREGSAVRYTQLGTVWIGERRNDPDRPSPRIQAVVEYLSGAGIPCVVPPDMEHALWNKFMLNVGINQWSAVLGAPYGVFHREEEARGLMRETMQEVVAVAHASGVTLSQKDVDHWFEVVATLGPEGKTSMLQDVTAGRKTEVEMFAGKVVELGQRWGVATPLNGALLRAIHVIEAEGLRQRD
ncbi:MAG: ketopantoate reductase family protein [Alkalispirochaeta sp.]